MFNNYENNHYLNNMVSGQRRTQDGGWAGKKVIFKRRIGKTLQVGKSGFTYTRTAENSSMKK